MAITLTSSWQKVASATHSVTTNTKGHLYLYLRCSGTTVYYEVRQEATNAAGNYYAWSVDYSCNYSITLDGVSKATGSYTQPGWNSNSGERVVGSGNFAVGSGYSGVFSLTGYIYTQQVTATSETVTVPVVITAPNKPVISNISWNGGMPSGTPTPTSTLNFSWTVSETSNKPVTEYSGHYSLFRGGNAIKSGVSFQISKSGGTGTLSMSSIGAQAGDILHFLVRVANSAGGVNSETEVYTIRADISAPTVSDVTFSNISYSSATASITSTNGGGTVDYYEIQVWLNEEEIQRYNGASNIFNLINLSPNTNYKIKAWSHNEKGWSNEYIKSLTTTNLSVPTVSDVTVTAITSTSANVSFTADANEGNITSLGIYLYNSNQEQIDNIGDSYSGTFNNLSPDTTYYVKAGAVNEAGLGVSPNYVEFTTASLQNANFTLTQTALSADSVSYSIVIDNINDATVTRSPSLVLTGSNGEYMTATGWDVTFNGLIPNSTYDLAVTVYTDIAPIHDYVSFTTLESTLPIHISLNGQEFANCSNIQISVKGSEFKPLTAEAIKAMKS